MRNTPIRLLLISLPLLLLISCKKDADPKSMTELLTQDLWKLQSATANGSDVTSQVPDCARDNESQFNANGTGNTYERTNVCTPTTEAAFTWSFQNNETEISMSAQLIPGGSGNFRILTLNETTLVLSQDSNMIPGTTITVVGTFIHP